MGQLEVKVFLKAEKGGKNDEDKDKERDRYPEDECVRWRSGSRRRAERGFASLMSWMFPCRSNYLQ